MFLTGASRGPALSAYGDPDIIQRATELGADAYLVKPIAPDDLLAAVHRGRRARSCCRCACSTTTAAAPPRTSRPARESGSVAAWIGNGSLMPRRDRTAHRGAGTPKSAPSSSSSASTWLSRCTSRRNLSGSDSFAIVRHDLPYCARKDPGASYLQVAQVGVAAFVDSVKRLKASLFPSRPCEAG